MVLKILDLLAADIDEHPKRLKAVDSAHARPHQLCGSVISPYETVVFVTLDEFGFGATLN
ncbi:hypothetical protein FBY06_1509 [Pseudomonas sp. SJZ085]|uniref:hypothetical protein n=1 Tax=unclassified Pseudomonas TaxID=196821 RepID=UPI0011991DDD|nr:MULTISPECIES: hypothetical protein [unclassified Pseudomonas]TWC11106.1 hypothetical protein FBX99_1509 [Pseudomonas sp. SJZ074]TWC29567.1 hypothetical protein FBY06_1509 [Pseudomonas sp. SJZ085]